jgi:hypothetical protein
MTTTIAEPITLPPPVDAHATVQRHQRQLAELQEKLESARTRRTDLIAERDRLQRERHQTAVSTLLGDGKGVEPDGDPGRLAQLDAEIDAAGATERAAVDAIAVLEKIAAGVRAQVESEIRVKVEAAARVVLNQAVAHVEQAIALHSQLGALAARAPDSGVGLMVQAQGLLLHWLQSAQRFGGSLGGHQT